MTLSSRLIMLFSALAETTNADRFHADANHVSLKKVLIDGQLHVEVSHEGADDVERIHRDRFISALDLHSGDVDDGTSKKVAAVNRWLKSPGGKLKLPKHTAEAVFREYDVGSKNIAGGIWQTITR